MMEAGDVLEILELAEEAGVRSWLDGGWAVDAALREQTRAHADLDLVVPMDHAPTLEAALAPAGFALVDGSLEANFILADGRGRRVDVHPVRFDANGDGLYRMDDGNDWRYPAEGFQGAGAIDGREVACLTPDVQMLCHAGGYLPGDTDFHDMALLHERFGTIALPPFDQPREPYYRADLARIHHLGFDFHANDCAPGILALLQPVLDRGGLVVELGCGSGLLTQHLVDAGHRVIATDASPAMLDLARELVPNTLEIRRLTLPDDPIPEADAIVSVGHVLSYLPDAEAIDRALLGIAQALRPDGQMAIDLCDLVYAEARGDLSTRSWVADDWALVTRFQAPTPDRFVRLMTMFTHTDDGSWRRDDERHDNVLIDTSRVPPLMAERGVQVRIGSSFGDEELPAGLRTVIGMRPA